MAIFYNVCAKRGGPQNGACQRMCQCLRPPISASNRTAHAVLLTYDRSVDTFESLFGAAALFVLKGASCGANSALCLGPGRCGASTARHPAHSKPCWMKLVIIASMAWPLWRLRDAAWDFRWCSRRRTFRRCYARTTRKQSRSSPTPPPRYSCVLKNSSRPQSWRSIAAARA